jgi:hypothetical protein
MARRTKKKSGNYPKLIVFNENLEGVADTFEALGFNIPEISVAIKGIEDHLIASNLDERVVFFTSDKKWLTRQPPYKHGAIIVLDTGNLSVDEKSIIIYRFLLAFHIKNKFLEALKNRRFRLTKYKLYEESIGEAKNLIWDFTPHKK